MVRSGEMIKRLNGDVQGHERRIQRLEQGLRALAVQILAEDAPIDNQNTTSSIDDTDEEEMSLELDEVVSKAEKSAADNNVDDDKGKNVGYLSLSRTFSKLNVYSFQWHAYRCC